MEVTGEYRALAVMFLVLHRELCLDDLLLDRALVISHIEVAHQLHGYRRAALQRGAVGYVLDRGAEQPRGVDAFVFVEALVLDRHGGVAEVGRDLIPRHGAAQLIRLDVPQSGAVRGEHL
jgi:hypothetical protein